MKKYLFFLIAFVMLVSCKKERRKVEEEVIVNPDVTVLGTAIADGTYSQKINIWDKNKRVNSLKTPDQASPYAYYIYSKNGLPYYLVSQYELNLANQRVYLYIGDSKISLCEKAGYLITNESYIKHEVNTVNGDIYVIVYDEYFNRYYYKISENGNVVTRNKFRTETNSDLVIVKPVDNDVHTVFVEQKELGKMEVQHYINQTLNSSYLLQAANGKSLTIFDHNIHLDNEAIHILGLQFNPEKSFYTKLEKGKQNILFELNLDGYFNNVSRTSLFEGNILYVPAYKNSQMGAYFTIDVSGQIPQIIKTELIGSNVANNYGYDYIFKIGSDIYVSGFENNEATYWKNGKQVKLDVTGIRESYITGIY